MSLLVKRVPRDNTEPARKQKSTLSSRRVILRDTECEVKVDRDSRLTVAAGAPVLEEGQTDTTTSTTSSR